MRRAALAALCLGLIVEVGGEDAGLSPGPANPADIGTRCAVIAGREDRGYLNCAEQKRSAQRPRQVERVEPLRARDSAVGQDERATRRSPVRGR
jgi:hypothetical protein